MRLAIEARLVEGKTTEEATHQWDEPVSSAPRAEGDPWEAKEGPHKTQSLQNEKQQLRDEQPQPDGDERRVTRLRGSPLREERADKKRGLKGRTVNILLLFLENPSRQQQPLICAGVNFLSSCVRRRFIYNLLQVLAKLLQAAKEKKKKSECVRLLVVVLKGFNVYLQVRNPSFAAPPARTLTHVNKQQRSAAEESVRASHPTSPGGTGVCERNKLGSVETKKERQREREREVP